MYTDCPLLVYTYCKKLLTDFTIKNIIIYVYDLKVFVFIVIISFEIMLRIFMNTKQ